MHNAKLDKSPRLQRVMKLLSTGHWYSTRDIIRLAGVCAVNSVVSELRCNGIDIECRHIGVGRFEYRAIGVEHANNPV